MGETKYYGACDDLANLHVENEHCKNWVPQLDEPLEPEASSLPASPAPDEPPRRDWAVALHDGTQRDLSDVEIETIKILARELYDRFVMGGWGPQDSYDQIARILVDGGLLAEARAGDQWERLAAMERAANVLIDYCEAHKWGEMPEPFDSINPLLVLLGRAPAPEESAKEKTR